MQHAKMLRVVGQQCCVRLHAALDVISLMIKSVDRAEKVREKIAISRHLIDHSSRAISA